MCVAVCASAEYSACRAVKIKVENFAAEGFQSNSSAHGVQPAEKGICTNQRSLRVVHVRSDCCAVRPGMLHFAQNLLTVHSNLKPSAEANDNRCPDVNNIAVYCAR